MSGGYAENSQQTATEDDNGVASSERCSEVVSESAFGQGAGDVLVAALDRGSSLYLAT